MKGAVAVAVLVGLVCAAGAVTVEREEGVAVLTEANFDAVIKKEDFVVVEFYAPWCGHCKKLAPEYAKAAGQLEGVATLAKVDATVETELAQRFEVRGYPTLKVFRNGVASDYKGGRTADTIVSYVHRQLQPACTKLDTVAGFESFVAKDPVVVGFFAAASGDAHAAYNAAANNLRDEYTFAEVTGADVATAAGVAAADLPVIKIFADGAATATYAGAADFADLATFVKVESLPLLADVNQETFGKYAESGLPVVFIFVDPSDATTKPDLEPDFTALAKTHRGSAAFVWCDGVAFKQHAQSLGLSGEVLPSVAILRLSDRSHFAYDGAITAAGLGPWMQSFVDGTLAPTIKSEPEPASQDGPVTVLVGTTFEAVSQDQTKDVLVEFYAPWCGHCKKLEPIYDELGETFKSVDSVVIAKMDATANDAVGVAIQGFPTIKFFPANSDKVVDYNGDRDHDSFVAFLKNNAAIPFTLGGGHDEL